MVVVGGEPGGHVGPVIFDVGGFVVVLGGQFLVGDRVLLWVGREVLPSMMRGGRAGFWK